MNVYERTRDAYTVSTDSARLDRPLIQRTLAATYWSPGIPAGLVDRALDHSLCFGLYQGDSQIGFARLVTDHATFAYLADVFILEGHRGHQLGVWLIECVMGHPIIAGLRRLMLVTRDAHGLYERYGFATPAHPERIMEIVRPHLYQAGR